MATKNTSSKRRTTRKSTGLTEILMVIDRSGSMGTIRDATISGINEFLESQRQLNQPTKVTYAQFDDFYEVVHKGKDVKNVPDVDTVTYVPRGMTALYDAIGRTVTEAKERITKSPLDRRPERVILTIVTDGHENASHEWNREQVRNLIESQRAEGWEIIFLGANQDAVLTAKRMGIDPNLSMTYAANARGASSAFRSVANNVVRMRQGVTKTAAFTEDDREEQRKAGLYQKR